MTSLVLSATQIDALRKHPHQHKYDHGHLLVLSGPRHQTGAARLAAISALRAGAGLVTMGATERTLPELAAHCTEVMLAQIETGAALSDMLDADQRVNALCIGPGLRVDRHGGDLVMHALQSKRPCVLDADALTLIAQNDALRSDVHDTCVLTPHMGEFKRLFPDINIDDKAKAAQTAADQIGSVILLKGSQTVIAMPGGKPATLDSSKMKNAPWLATAGAGDVLAGIIAGLLARGIEPVEAAQIGAVLHLHAAGAKGPGLVAGDLPYLLPKALQDLGV
ncbi:NAD(P)H-hydrate dehydratase [uncultured Litoreibacter sp.]|uniref:NAD(P)H-hydrate dehydratase n=1 Tax=uncultured Litoreibacter sp. TaxID=1392394 RepID=UPI0026208D4E|nr:NAD(P)H-hydrate dehydratase [uncultured Litoreibacter sp.]